MTENEKAAYVSGVIAERKRCMKIVKVHESPHTPSNCKLCKIQNSALDKVLL